MTPKLTSVAKGVIVGLAVNDGGRLGESLKSGLPRVSEATMPSGRGRGGHKSAGAGGGRRELQGVERSRTVTAKEEVPGTKILHRDTKRVKFNRNKIISGELANGQKVFNNVGGKENIVETEWASKC
jgi:hypothetical protein